MMKLTIGGTEMFDESSQEFTLQGEVTLELEHSLVSLSKWESEFEKPFLGNDSKTPEEIIGYVKAMTLTPGVPEEVYEELSHSNFEDINSYIEAKMTATWFNEGAGTSSRNREVITAELIYYWLVAFQIPFQCETWHLNRLFTLIRTCSIKQETPKKMSRSAAAAQQREINERRRAQTGSKG
jgi:hypothetical protein